MWWYERVYAVHCWYEIAYCRLGLGVMVSFNWGTKADFCSSCTKHEHRDSLCDQWMWLPVWWTVKFPWLQNSQIVNLSANISEYLATKRDYTYVNSGTWTVNTNCQKIFRVRGSKSSTAAKQAKKHEKFLSVCQTIKSYGTHGYIGTHICQIILCYVEIGT